MSPYPLTWPRTEALRWSGFWMAHPGGGQPALIGCLFDWTSHLPGVRLGQRFAMRLGFPAKAFGKVRRAAGRSDALGPVG